MPHVGARVKQRRHSRYDYAVIGAGAAGLAAARALSGAGKRVCILEARPRIGGRVFTQHIADLPVPIELGAEFIHGESETTFNIVNGASLAACELPDEHLWSRNGQWVRVADFWEEIDRIRRKIRPRKRDISFAEFLRSRRELTPRQRDLACNFVEGYHAAHADRISALALKSADEEQDPSQNRQFRLAGGQDALLEWLRAGLDPQRTDLLLGTVAKRVQWSPRAVTIECSGHDPIRASALIITIPIGVWKAPAGQEGAIEFDPPLKEKENAVAKLEAGHVVKIVFRFRERFWGDGEQPAPNFLHGEDRFMPVWWTTAPIRSPVLVGWAGGGAADALLAEGRETLHDRALDAMSRAWCVPRRRIDALLAGTFMHDWQSDPYSRCAYSYAGVGGSDAHAALAKPVRGTLYFAGEATSGDQTGTVAGAIDSGFRAAREALKRA
ncbi:MAG TPA: NAD(P)/FAD-dependent oxidoreductase [Thermoanaerobaculia bacterium]|nr:NAD(P)/FAD-dependent oxidoreductase [Thermoanaerobaculia bacterium]